MSAELAHDFHGAAQAFDQALALRGAGRRRAPGGPDPERPRRAGARPGRRGRGVHDPRRGGPARRHGRVRAVPRPGARQPRAAPTRASAGSRRRSRTSARRARSTTASARRRSPTRSCGRGRSTCCAAIRCSPGSRSRPRSAPRAAPVTPRRSRRRSSGSPSASSSTSRTAPASSPTRASALGRDVAPLTVLLGAARVHVALGEREPRSRLAREATNVAAARQDQPGYAAGLEIQAQTTDNRGRGGAAVRACRGGLDRVEHPVRLRPQPPDPRLDRRRRPGARGRGGRGGHLPLARGPWTGERGDGARRASRPGQPARRSRSRRSGGSASCATASRSRRRRGSRRRRATCSRSSSRGAAGRRPARRCSSCSGPTRTRSRSPTGCRSRSRRCARCSIRRSGSRRTGSSAATSRRSGWTSRTSSSTSRRSSATAAEGLRLARAGDRAAARASLEAAETRYGGDFLEEDPYEDWAVGLREEAQAAYISVTRLLADEAAASGRRGWRDALLPADPGARRVRRGRARRAGGRAARGRASRRGAPALRDLRRQDGGDGRRGGAVPVRAPAASAAGRRPAPWRECLGRRAPPSLGLLAASLAAAGCGVAGGILQPRAGRASARPAGRAAEDPGPRGRRAGWPVPALGLSDDGRDVLRRARHAVDDGPRLRTRAGRPDRARASASTTRPHGSRVARTGRRPPRSGCGFADGSMQETRALSAPTAIAPGVRFYVIVLPPGRRPASLEVVSGDR